MHERERRGGGERGCGRRGKEKDGKRKGEKNEKTSKKSFQNRSSLRGHEEVGVAVGEVTDGQADGAEQEEVHRVLCFLFRERMEVEQGKERGEPKKEEADETTSKRKEEKRAASRRELRREESCVAKRAVSRRELRREESCVAKRVASRKELRGLLPLRDAGPRPRRRDAQGRALRERDATGPESHEKGRDRGVERARERERALEPRRRPLFSPFSKLSLLTLLSMSGT